MSRRRFLTILAIILILSPLANAGASVRITVLHVNDFHGRVFPYIEKSIDPSRPVSGAAYLAEAIKRERLRNPEGTILLSAGDMFQGTPVSNLFRGRPVLETMNALRFDAMTLGNHEFDWGRDVLGDILSAVRFPVLSANIVDEKGNCIPGVRPYAMIERKGVRIAVIGLTTTDLSHMVNSKYLTGLAVLDPLRVVPDLAKKARAEGAQVVVLLTHIGFDEDKRLAAGLEGVDLIVGGHSHTVVKEPVVVGKTIIVQAGYGVHLGVMEMTIDEKTGRIIDATTKNELEPILAGPNDPFDAEVAKIAKSYGERIESTFRQVVGETKGDLTRASFGESTLGDVITDAMRASANAEVALHNSGGIRADILAGKITMEQVFTVLPFDNTVVSMDLSGSDLLAILERSAGANKGMLQVSGVRVEYDRNASKAKSVQVNGRPLEKDRMYRVATNDFLAAGGDYFGPFKNGRNVAYGGDLREVFVDYLKSHSPLSIKGGERIVTGGK
jgi:2',3'-cyclic-nucleotide 2'-phosphodiesterase (5'-nucleotidase family)